MQPFRRVSHAFIMTFGITQPRPSQEQLATIVIVSLLTCTLLGAIGMGAFLLHTILGG
jgi:preprotein translocase subunit Sss1